MTVASAVVTKVDLEANKNSVVVAEAAGVATKAVVEEVKIPGIKWWRRRPRWLRRQFWL